MKRTKLQILHFMFLSFVVCGIYSCNNDDDYETITLSCISNNTNFDNQTRQISLSVHNEPVSMSISGGDGHYTIQNNNPSVFNCLLTGNVVVFMPIAIGKVVITIIDSSNNEYKLHIDIIPNQYQVSSYAVIISDKMENRDIAELEGRIISDAPKGMWQLIANNLNTGIAKLYLSDSNASDFKKYNYTINGDILSDVQKPILYGFQFETWLTMKSEDEELTLFITQPITLNGTLISANSLVRDVTLRYINEYPKLERAYEIQNYKYN